MACDQYHHYRDDIALMKKLGIESYRFSFSWSRILPNGIGCPNQKGVDYYHRLIDELHANNIIPNATLYHWDLPYALDLKGGWCNRDIVQWFGDYAELMFKEFGNQIPLWSTVNEPIATYIGYSGGKFAPAHGDAASGRQANHNLLLAHGEAVRRFRALNLNNSKIGIVVDVWHHHPLRPNVEADVALAQMKNHTTYLSYLDPVFKGAYSPELLRYMEQERSMPDIQSGDMARICEKLDFFGMNCYNRVVDCADPALLPKKPKASGGNFQDNPFDFYPKAVYDALHILRERYALDIPIYITENGTFNCGEEISDDGRIHDAKRIEYMEGFLYWIGKALEENFDIRGYYLWSLLDNWEWTAGFASRYGICHTDFATQARIVKDSALWYRDMIAKRKLDR